MVTNEAKEGNMTTISITHPNGETTTRKTDRPYTHGVVIKIYTSHTLVDLRRKADEIWRDMHVWAALIDGDATLVCDGKIGNSRNGSTCIRHDIKMNDGSESIYNALKNWQIIPREDGETDEQHAAKVTAIMESTEGVLRAKARNQIKTLIKRHAKVTNEIAHVESLGGETYGVWSFHSRYDLAEREANVARERGCRVVGIVEIDQ